jgi:hypothetical protein
MSTAWLLATAPAGLYSCKQQATLVDSAAVQPSPACGTAGSSSPKHLPNSRARLLQGAALRTPTTSAVQCASVADWPPSLAMQQQRNIKALLSPEQCAQ